MEKTGFSKAELERYSRHLILPGFTIEGQRKLKEAKVLVVGAGGLGAPLLSYLTAAGIGHIGILDFDVVEASNLHRQVLFTVGDVGRPKVEVAGERLKALNPHVCFTLHHTRLTRDNALDIIGAYDIVADGTDNFPTRYLINDACVLLGKANVHASIHRFEGQVSVFNYTDSEGRTGPDYRDLFPEPPPPGEVPSCAEGGVIGVLPGIIGSLQANEVLKVISGIGEPLSGRLFLFDGLSMETRTLKLHRETGRSKVMELTDYEDFCGVGAVSEGIGYLREITAGELQRLRAEGKAHQLIDVREPYEREIASLGGELVPLGEIESFVHKIAVDQQVIIYCRSGRRSAKAIKVLETKYGFSNLVNLKGGILAWAEEIDSGMAKY